jgi:predicted Zn-dependent peptidase
LEQSIFSHVYPNGLVLVAEEMQSLESAAFTFRVPAGCIYEPADRGGLAGLTCEMALRGAGPRDNRQFINDLDNLGVERGESVSDAHTNYSGATLAKSLLPTLAIYADLLERPHMPDDQLESGRLIALQELSAVEDEPAQKVMLELRRRHYPDPWGRPSQGSEQGLTNSSMDEIRAFFSRHYRPDGTILGIAGRFDWPRLRDAVGELLAGWKAAPQAEPKEAPLGPRVAHLEHESNQTQIGVAYSSAAYRDADYFQAWGSVGVLSGGMSSRLFTEVREKRGLCYSVYASHHSLKDRGAVMCYAGTTAERAQETLDVMLGELRRLGDGVLREELDRLKARIKSALIMQQESSSSRSAALARDWYYLGRVRTLDEIGRLVDELSCDTINAYLADHRPQDFTIVTLGPQALEVPVGVS